MANLRTGLKAAAILLSFTLPLPAAASSRAQRARGAADFVSTGCEHCHSIRQIGGHRGPDLSGVGRRKGKTAIRNQILYGSKVMPAFGDVLTPEEVKDLVAYLRSCRSRSADGPARERAGPLPPSEIP